MKLCDFMTELVIVLNHKIWQWFECNDELAALYEMLWTKSNRYCMQHFTGEALTYFFRTTD